VQQAYRPWRWFRFDSVRGANFFSLHRFFASSLFSSTYIFSFADGGTLAKYSAFVENISGIGLNNAATSYRQTDCAENKKMEKFAGCGKLRLKKNWSANGGAADNIV
jgi:hypothetical protein